MHMVVVGAIALVGVIMGWLLSRAVRRVMRDQ